MPSRQVILNILSIFPQYGITIGDFVSVLLENPQINPAAVASIIDKAHLILKLLSQITETKNVIVVIDDLAMTSSERLMSELIRNPKFSSCSSAFIGVFFYLFVSYLDVTNNT